LTEEDDDEIGPSLTYPDGRSFAATRIKGRGFLFPPPKRHSVASQTSKSDSEACPYQAFLAGSTPFEDNGELLLYLVML
jgi:hypothetical protein